MENIPKHIAIIMDGNGRWAKKKRLPKIMGHRSGVKIVDEITEACSDLGVKALTLYTFSTENWKRPKREVDALLKLFEKSLKKKAKKLKKENIKFNVIGRRDSFSKSFNDIIDNVEKETSESTGMTLTLALNYGGRQEILDAVRSIADSSKKKGIDLASIEEKDIEKALYTKGLPELDLIIRTSGEKRLSNFLIWQAAYAEFYFTDVLWPDFDAKELNKAIKSFAHRDRRYGG